MNLNGFGAMLPVWKLQQTDIFMDWSFRQNWDEFTWSKEIRKDELRIAGYFRTLPSCLDLPGEDEMIFNRLMNQPEMVPSGVSDPQRMLKSELEQAAEEEAEWDEERRENRRRNAFEATRRVENLAREWNLLSASRFDQSATRGVLSVCCSLGKILSRAYNFEETDDAEDTLNLRISLLKRMLADVNEAVQSLNDFSKEYTFDRLDEFCNTLAFVRENVLDKLKTLRDK